MQSSAQQDATAGLEIDPMMGSESPFTRGNFAPVAGEQTIGELEVEGRLPREIAGRLLRNGPNPPDPGSLHHWFIGDAMLHAVHIEDGKALGYRNRWVRTPEIERLKGLSAAPHRGPELVAQGSGNVNVIEHAGRVLALSEIGLPWELTKQLETLGRYDFAGKLKSNMTAHPKIDQATGELVFFGYDFGDVHLRYHVADASGALVHSEEISTPLPTMMHDFGVTETRVVFMDFPVVFDLEMVAEGHRLPYRWRDDVGARLGVMPRRGNNEDVVWIDIDPCYVYHPLNAYDDGDQIVMDVAWYDKTFAPASGPPENRLLRWTIDPRAGKVSSDVIDDRAQEFPRVDPRVECRRHRYGYTVEMRNERGPAFGGLLKHDLQRGTTEVHSVGDQCQASEGVFVPVGEAEDAGYLIAPVYDGHSNTSHIRVIDASDFTAPPVAKIKLPTRIPFGFHGNFVTV